MDQKKIYHIIEWVVALAACGYLIYRLAVYDDYAGLWAALCGMGWMQWGALALCVALMPVNMSLEAWRWKTLWNYELKIKNYELMSFAESHRQVYYSKLAGLITPWRLGEYPSRAILMSSQPSAVSDQKSLWARVLSMGAVGSATMTIAIIVAGVAAMIVGVTGYGLPVTGDGRYAYLIGVAIILLLLAVGLWFAPQLLRRWADVSHRLVAVSLGQSLVRLLCWCGQLALVLYALGAVTGYGLWVTVALCAVYYLLVTITPNVPIAEVGVRGAWAIWVFGSMNAALAGVLLWGINTLLPCLIWPFLKKNIILYEYK